MHRHKPDRITRLERAACALEELVDELAKQVRKLSRSVAAIEKALKAGSDLSPEAKAAFQVEVDRIGAIANPKPPKE